MCCYKKLQGRSAVWYAPVKNVYIAMVLMCTGNNYNYVFKMSLGLLIGLIKMYNYSFGLTANVYWWMDNMSQIGSWA